MVLSHFADFRGSAVVIPIVCDANVRGQDAFFEYLHCAAVYVIHRGKNTMDENEEYQQEPKTIGSSHQSAI